MIEMMGPGDSLSGDVVALARRLDRPVASLSTDEIAAGLGISRSTLYRRIGSRDALLQALRDQGIDTGEKPSATERMLDAAAVLIREGGLQSLTLEAVASRADVALPTVFGRFRNRTGLLVAVFERHSPVPLVQQHLALLEPGDQGGFRTAVRAVYGEIWDLLMTDYALISALLIEVLREPHGEVREFLERRYLPQVFDHILPWIGENIRLGIVRPIPPLLLGQAFVAPLIMHVATRPLVQSTGIAALPDRDEACARFTDLYCAAVLVPEGAKEHSNDS